MSSFPSQFGPSYELIRRLGAGGMAETFLARRRGLGGFEQYVCIKRILPAFEEDENFVRLFLEEARVSARLRHANIVQVIDFGVVEGSHFLALELVDGMDLRGLLKALSKSNDALTSGLVSYLASELANALEYAHAIDSEGQLHGVVHRDISPSNVLVSRAGEIKLTDFGIAKAMNQPGVTKSGVIKGKVPYMAPEYARLGKFDARSDLFALGVLLYECLTGRRPFEGVTELDTLERIASGTHTPLAELVPKAPRKLVEAIERLILPDPAQRFDHAAAFLDALVDDAPPPTARRILGELVRRHGGAMDIDGVSPSLHGRPHRPTPISTEVLGDQNTGPNAAPVDVKVAAPSAPTRTSLPKSPTVAETVIRQDRRRAEEGPPSSTHQGVGRMGGGRAAGQAEMRSGGESRHRQSTEGYDGSIAVAKDLAEAEPVRSEPPPVDRPNEPNTHTRPRTGDAPGMPDKTPHPGSTSGSVPALQTSSKYVVPAPSSVRPARGHARLWLGVAAGVVISAVLGAGILALSSGDEEPKTQRVAAKVPPRAEPARTEPAKTEPSPRPPGTGTPPVSQPTSNEDAVPSADLAGQPEPLVEATADEVQEPGGAVETKKATLRIYVMPFGDVWVDGKREGHAPATVVVEPGKHLIAAGEGRPTEKKEIDVRAGERKRIVFKLRGL